MPSPPQVGNEVTCFCSTIFQNGASTTVVALTVDVIAGDANAAAYIYYKSQEYPDLYNSSVAVMLREMQREVKTGHPFEAGFFTLIILPIMILLSFTQQMILIVALWLFSLTSESRLGRRICENWSNITTSQSANLSEQADGKRGTKQKTIRVSEESKAS